MSGVHSAHAYPPRLSRRRPSPAAVAGRPALAAGAARHARQAQPPSHSGAQPARGCKASAAALVRAVGLLAAAHQLLLAVVVVVAVVAVPAAPHLSTRRSTPRPSRTPRAWQRPPTTSDASRTAPRPPSGHRTTTAASPPPPPRWPSHRRRRAASSLQVPAGWAVRPRSQPPRRVLPSCRRRAPPRRSPTSLLAVRRARAP